MEQPSLQILVTGGAGYIGSHAVRRLADLGHSVTVLDNLSHGHQRAVDARAEFIPGSTADSSLVLDLLRTRKIEAVLHFAADIEVGESVLNPAKYYENNFSNAVRLFECMREAHVQKIVFSSTAAVYGDAKQNPVEESAPLAPINPYGDSKLKAELALADFSRAHGLGYAVLRYFNVAGAHPDGTIGEDHHPESHLIPRILASARDEKVVKIYGTDYATADGTCVRDYIHVVDLVNAHILALGKMKNGAGSVYNLGSENGFSVREVIAACEKVVGKKLKIEEVGRRAGDSAVLVASSKKARVKLGWTPEYPELEMIVKHAWNWHLSHPQGYRSVNERK